MIIYFINYLNNKINEYKKTNRNRNKPNYYRLFLFCVWLPGIQRGCWFALVSSPKPYSAPTSPTLRSAVGPSDLLLSAQASFSAPSWEFATKSVTLPRTVMAFSSTITSTSTSPCSKLATVLTACSLAPTLPGP